MRAIRFGIIITYYLAQAPTTACVDVDLAADGAPTDRGVLVQSGRMFFGGCSGLVVVAAISSSSSSSSCCENASSHFSRVISAPPVLRALNAWNPNYLSSTSYPCERIATYPARDPPTHASTAGENAGALPALAFARSEDNVDTCGEGLLRIAKYGMSGRSAA